MMRTKKLTVATIVILFSLLLSVILPTGVLADDATPPQLAACGHHVSLDRADER